MKKDSVSNFFKRMFQRNRGNEPESSHICHDCQKSLVAENMGPRLLERCPECRGIWLSASQLQEILEQVAHKVENCDTVESDGHATIGNTFAPSRVSRKCPECAEEMNNYQFEETGIWIDGCPSAHGIWLDQGELRLLVQRTRSKSDSEQYDHGSVIDAVSDLIIGSL